MRGFLLRHGQWVAGSISRLTILPFQMLGHQILSDKQHPYSNDEHGCLQCLNWSTAYGITVLERLMRLESSRLSELVDTRFYKSLQALVSLTRVQLHFFTPIYPRRVFGSLVNYLLVNTVYTSSPYSCLDLDAFSLLVSLIATGPSFFDDFSSDDQHQSDAGAIQQAKRRPTSTFMVPLGNSCDRNLIELMIAFHMVQV